jgi:uncharacterized protein YdeI (YjbR/CyaY-like superfamily)
VGKAASLNEAGVKNPPRAKSRVKPRLELPNNFAAALRKNSKARKTFDNLSPGGKRDYVEWISDAKREETQKTRLATSMKWLAQGKPHNWKYMPEWR